MKIIVTLKIILTLIVSFLLAGDVFAQSPMDAVQNDHVAANVPRDDVFDSFFTLDMLAYLESEISPDIASVETELLRDEATQSGAADPKFYVWVKATTSSGSVREGAARVAAINEQYFEVTHFLVAEEIVLDPQALYSVFPAPLIPAIMAKAANQ